MIIDNDIIHDFSGFLTSKQWFISVGGNWPTDNWPTGKLADDNWPTDIIGRQDKIKF